MSSCGGLLDFVRDIIENGSEEEVRLVVEFLQALRVRLGWAREAESCVNS